MAALRSFPVFLPFEFKMRVLEFEYCGRFTERIRLTVELFGVDGEFLTRGGVALDGAVELLDYIFYLLDGVHLAAARLLDVGDEVGALLDGRHDVVEHFGGNLGGFQRIGSTVDDVVGGIFALFGEFADFRRHNGKTLAVFARTCSLHCGVEREDVGLER